MFVCKQKTGNCTIPATNNIHHMKLSFITDILSLSEVLT